MRSSLLISLLILTTTAAAAQPSTDEAELRRIDDRQRQIIEAADVAAMRALAHPNLRVNAPTGRVLTHDQLLAMMGSGAIAAENFTRTPESVVVTGDIGVVMGRETVTPTKGSASGRMFGARILSRRYTNVYIRTPEGWKFLARHANVAPPTATPK